MKSIMQHWPSRYRSLLIGLALVISAPLLLTGATLIQAGVGRYQIASWGFATGADSGRFGAFVLDTTTGETKSVYEAEFDNARLKILTNHLGRSFFYYDNSPTDSGLSIRELKDQASSALSQKDGE